jgi:YihY family inner membrane protein
MGEPFAKFFADRGTHLAAMIAYFALLSLLPLVFLTLALLGLSHRVEASDFFVRELNHAFPPSSVQSIVRVVRAIQDNAATLGVIGGLFLLWSSLSLFSALESAFNIVYGRSNRGFLHGKGVAALLMVGFLVTLYAALVVAALGAHFIRDYAPGALTSGPVAYGVPTAASLLGIFLFLVAVYTWLTNARVRIRDALPGAIFGAVVLEASFQVLPLFVHLESVNVTLKAFGAPVLLLLWLYLMANVIVFGAELNLWYSTRGTRATDELPGLA